MSLLPCPACKKEISKKANLCVSCGHPDPFHQEVKSKVVWFIFWAIAVILGVWIAWHVVIPYIIDMVKNI